MLNTQNIQRAKTSLLFYNRQVFTGIGNCFLEYLYELDVENFRHINDLKVQFVHPVTIISGSNKIGKTSMLLLIACSHVNFKKFDSTKPTTELRNHLWRDVITFTSHETVNNDYIYRLKWRKGQQERQGEGKRTSVTGAWTGLAKFSSQLNRINAKIRDREVRLIDLERIIPARNFSNSLFRKIDQVNLNNRLSPDVERAFSFIFSLDPNLEIYNIGSHVNKIAYLIRPNQGDSYSSYNAASGEESLLNMLTEIIDTQVNSLILIDEIEAAFHPTIQRRIADIIQYFSWHHKKQFILTTHSPTMMGAFPQKSRVFIDKKNDGSYESIANVPINVAFSKMDSQSHPLINLYCEDEEAKYIIRNLLIGLNSSYKNFDKLVNIISSGPINAVRDDYTRHKRNYSQMRLKIGFACIFDGDYKNDPNYSIYYKNPDEFSFFLYPFMAPEKFLISSFLSINPNDSLRAAFNFNDHHTLFQEMQNLGIAANRMQARELCWRSFIQTAEYTFLRTEFNDFILATVKHFAELSE